VGEASARRRVARHIGSSTDLTEEAVDEHRFELDPYIIQFSRFKARQLAGKYGFERLDMEDIEQELLLDFIERSRSFDSCRGSSRTFATRIINHRIANILEARKAGYRDYRVVSRMDERSPVLGTTRPTFSWQAGKSRRENTLNLKLDVARTVAGLPEGLRKLCCLLMLSDSAVEVASIAGISRSTLHRRIRRLRSIFNEAGLQESLISRRSLSAAQVSDQLRKTFSGVRPS
jgi:RNA polymerase sigma-70 factor (ECF subfamily)